MLTNSSYFPDLDSQQALSYTTALFANVRKNSENLETENPDDDPPKSYRKKESKERDSFVGSLNPGTGLSSSLYYNIASFPNLYRDLFFNIQEQNTLSAYFSETRRAAELQLELKKQVELQRDWAIQMQKISEFPQRFFILNADKLALVTTRFSEPLYSDLIESIRISDQLQSIVTNSFLMDHFLNESMKQIEQMKLFATQPIIEQVQVFSKLLPDIVQSIQPLQDLHNKINNIAMQASEVREYVASKEYDSEEQSSVAEEFGRELSNLPVYLEVKAAVFEQLYYNLRDEMQATIDNLKEQLAYEKEEKAYAREDAAFYRDEAKRLQILLDEMDQYLKREEL